MPTLAVHDGRSAAASMRPSDVPESWDEVNQFVDADEKWRFSTRLIAVLAEHRTTGR